MHDKRFLAANHSTILPQALTRCRVDYAKIPTMGSVYDDFPAASQLRLPLLLHNAHVNVPVADPALQSSLDLDRFRDAIRLTRTPHLSFHLDAPEPARDDEALISTAIRNVRWLASEFELPILVETPCLWADRAHTQALAAPENLRRILDETGALLLLDLSHVRCSAHFFARDERPYLESLPVERTHEIHLAGSRMIPGRGRIDVHAPLDDRDYELLQWALDHTPVRFVTLEYGGSTAGSAVDVCRDEDIRRNDPKALERQLQRLARTIEA